MKKDSMAAKKKKKKKTPELIAWHITWCREHIAELRACGGWITVHPKHGIVCSDAHSILGLIGRGRFLKRSILRDCVHLQVATILKKIDPQIEVESKDDDTYNGHPKWVYTRKEGDPVATFSDNVDPNSLVDNCRMVPECDCGCQAPDWPASSPYL